MINRKYILIPVDLITKKMIGLATQTSMDTLIKYVAPNMKEYYWLGFNKKIPRLFSPYQVKTQVEARKLVKAYRKTIQI